MLRETERRTEILWLINYHGVVPSNFLYELDKAKYPDTPTRWDRTKRNLKYLKDVGLIDILEQTYEYHDKTSHFPIYGLTPKGKDYIYEEHSILPHGQWAKQDTWHQLLLAETVLSFQIACAKYNWNFQTRDEILHGKLLALPCTIYYNGQSYDIDVEPDDIFGINDYVLGLEVDNDSEARRRQGKGLLHKSNYWRKLLQYSEVFSNRTYYHEWGIPGLTMLNVFNNKSRLENLMEMMEDEGVIPEKMFFKSIPQFGSKKTDAEPLLTILDDRWQRVGHDPVILGMEVMKHGRQTATHKGTDRTERAHGR